MAGMVLYDGKHSNSSSLALGENIGPDVELVALSVGKLRPEEPRMQERFLRIRGR